MNPGKIHFRNVPLALFFLFGSESYAGPKNDLIEVDKVYSGKHLSREEPARKTVKGETGSHVAPDNSQTQRLSEQRGEISTLFEKLRQQGLPASISAAVFEAKQKSSLSDAEWYSYVMKLWSTDYGRRNAVSEIKSVPILHPRNETQTAEARAGATSEYSPRRSFGYGPRRNFGYIPRRDYKYGTDGGGASYNSYDSDQSDYIRTPSTSFDNLNSKRDELSPDTSFRRNDSGNSWGSETGYSYGTGNGNSWNPNTGFSYGTGHGNSWNPDRGFSYGTGHGNSWNPDTGEFSYGR